MALDRQSIEKKDFPVGRRGYEPAAVDAHLSSISEEVEELKRASRKRTESLATASGEQVRAIIDAAENSAAEIHRLAEEDAREIRADATSDANATRNRATSETREYIDKVSTATTDLLARIDAMQSELDSLFQSLKTGATGINADLQRLEANVQEVRDATAPPRFEPEPEAAAEPPAAKAAAHEEAAKGTPAGSGAAPTTGATVRRDPTAGADDDTEGARLIALNMALNGTAREDTDRYLAENFKLTNRAALLDEVYEKVEG